MAAKKTARKSKTAVLPPVLKRVGDKDHRVDLSDYHKVKSASGNASLDSGDAIAKSLRGMELDDVYKTASKVLREPVTVLKQRYSKLNPGMQRMNLGNRMRGAQA